MSRRLFAEFLGSLLLAAAVVGSGVMAERLTHDVALALLANTAATVTVLAALIAALAPVSGAHFNPVVSLVALSSRQIDARHCVAYVVAQLLGCCAGAMLAHGMFDLALVQASTHSRTGVSQLISEVVATAGLVLIAFTSPSAKEVAWRVPAWIAGAYWFTASTSFANPAITIARSLTDTFSGIRRADTIGFIAAQLVGGALGLACVRVFAGRSPRI